MIKSNVFDQDRDEPFMYKNTTNETEVIIPVTRAGFEALLERASLVHGLPVEPLTREVLAKYLNHVSNQEQMVTIQSLGDRLYRSVSHALTWVLDQERKDAQMKEEKDKFEAELAAKQLAGNVTDITKAPASPVA
jgi:hypothetical protein